MANEHSNYCRKEKEIAEIHTKVNQIEKVVMGKEGLIVTVPLLKQSIDNLNLTMVGLERGMKGFFKYQQTMEGMATGKASLGRRNRWVVGILVTVNIALLGGVITLIIKLVP